MSIKKLMLGNVTCIICYIILMRFVQYYMTPVINMVAVNMFLVVTLRYIPIFCKSLDKLSFNNKAGMHLNSSNIHYQGKPKPVPDKMDSR